MTTEGIGLLPLLVWTSPAFPVGAFAYSHGLEWAVESDAVRDAAGLEAWLRDLLDHGAPRNDSILAACAWRAAGRDERRSRAPSPRERGEGPGDFATPDRPSPQPAVAAVEVTPSAPRPSPLQTPSPLQAHSEQELGAINELALALAGSRERHLETTQQGNAFVLAARAAWPCTTLDRLVETVPGDIAYPVAFATAAAGHAIALPAALEAFVLGLVANLVSAAVRLGVVGQTDGQRVLAALAAPIGELAAAAAVATLDDLGAAAFAADIAALRHETQYSRLFRS